MKSEEVKFEDYLLTTDRAKMDIVAIHDFLSIQSDWSRNIPFELVKKSIDNSLNFGLFYKEEQIVFARVISDFSTIAYLGDIYILSEYRGKGLSKKLMSFIMAHPHLQGLRRWILLTSTAEWLYAKYGFSKLKNPDLYMEMHQSDLYSKRRLKEVD